MKEYVIDPLKGVLPVLLGMPRAESRDAMKDERLSTIEKAKGFPLVDSYHDASFQVFFDETDCVNYIELSDSGNLRSLYKGLDVFSTDADAMLKRVAQDAEPNPTDLEFGYTFVFPSLSLALWRPVVPSSADDEQGRRFSTIGIGAPGYFE